MKNVFARGIDRLMRAAWSGAGIPGGISGHSFRRPIESLESRLLLSVNVTTYRYDIDNTGAGANSAETVLTQSNVGSGALGKKYSVPVDGFVYAQPLVESGVTITAGANTASGATGVHNVVFVATENDSVYAIDTGSGSVLWQRSFLNASGPGVGSTAGTNINNTLGASAITTVPSADTSSEDLIPQIGITSTPVIDTANNRIFVIDTTKETINGVDNWVQHIHALSLSNGTDVVAPYMIGAIPTSGSIDTNIYVYGTGDGSVVDPYNNTGRQVVQFNALRENQRCALSLVNGVVYAEWSSHGDQPPYHGWLVGWNVANLANTGFVVKGVFNDTPNGGNGGIWMAGAPLAFENDGTTFYVEIGNATGAAGTYDSNGFPTDGNYGESLVKMTPDSTTSPTNQSLNGWGFKVVDFFTPFNRATLDTNDTDFGAGGMLILPTGIAGHPNLILASGKEGKIYVLDRDNLGKFNATNDSALNSVPNGLGNNTPPIQLAGGSYSSPAYYNGVIYYVGGQNDTAYSFTLNSDGSLTQTSTAAQSTYGLLPGSPTISSNGASNGILWQIDRNANVLRAFAAGNWSTELWDSGQAAGGTDALDSTVKFTNPVVANGEVFVGTTDSLTVYGLEAGEITVANASQISGNAFDPTNLSAPNAVQIIISGGPAPQTIMANLSSPELMAKFGTTSNDFNYTMPILSAGVHTVSVYSINENTSARTLLGTTTITSQNSLFDEHYYLMMNPDVAAAVAAGRIATGYDHYIKYGQFEGRSPSPYWNEAYYLLRNPDVAAAVSAHKISSGFMHYYLYGQYENRPGLLYFNENYYLQNNADVAAAVTSGALSSGFEHFVLFGQYEGRSPMLYFSSTVYDNNNPDILAFVTGEPLSTDFDHFVMYGQYENRVASNFYNEQTYLADNPDVAAAVSEGRLADGLQHWLEYGQYEGRTAV